MIILTIDLKFPPKWWSRSSSGGSATRASRFRLAEPKDMRAKDFDFYCIFERRRGGSRREKKKKTGMQETVASWRQAR